MFTKNHHSFKSIFILFLSVVFALTSCDSFMNSNILHDEIEKRIAYVNAESVSVLVLADNQTGTTVPSGKEEVKVGYSFDVKFNENPSYSFIKWAAVMESDGSDASEFVSFDDANSVETKVTLNATVSGIKIYPLCAERISVVGEPSPKWEAKGVSRDRSIAVQFSKKISASSFYFTEDEIPSDVTETKANEKGNIYAYVKNGITTFKNISITNSDDISLCEHFLEPQINENLLTINVDRTNPIEIETGVSFKTISVTISGDISDESGVKMNSVKNWKYQITTDTDEKAWIKITSNQAEGSVYNGDRRDYNLGQTITLSFTENADYQFIKWSYDDSIVLVTDDKKISTTAYVKEKSDDTEIKAICAPRLNVVNFSPVNNAENPSVCKNSSIVIKFNKSLPTDEADKTQLNNISISIGGTPVKSSFENPVIENDTVTFKADKLNPIDVGEGQTKSVTVSIPSDFYYKLEDGTKVTYGGNGVSYDYKIDHTTLSKSEITFTSTSGSGTTTPSGSGNKYSIGQEVPLKFNLNDGYIFNGWTITSGGNEVSESEIKIADKTSPDTKMYIYEAVPAVTVTADCSQKLSVSNNLEGNTAKPKDSDIVLTFNKTLDSACASLLNKIKVSINGSNIDANFATRTLENGVVTLKNTKLPEVTGTDVKTVTVTVPAVFFYKDREKTVKMDEEYSFSYSINAATNAKAKIDFEVIDGETELEITDDSAGVLNIFGYQEFDIGQTLPLNLNVDSQYQFYGWNVKDSSGNSVSSDVMKLSASNASLTSLTLSEACEGIIISAVVYKRPLVISKTPYSTDSIKEYAKDTSISVTFSHSIYEGVEKNIQLSYSNGNINKDLYFNTSLSADKTSVTLLNKKLLSVENAYETVTVVVPHDKIYYLASDNKTKIYMDDSEDVSWSYRINKKTTDNVTIRFLVENSNPLITGVKVNNTLLASGTKEIYSLEESISLNYPLQSGYKFEGWKLETALSGYTITPSGYVTEGSVYIKNGSKTCLSLTIDENDPTKAVIKVIEGINNSGDLYGVSVFSKDILIPSITTISPEYASLGVNCDTPIVIEFNKEIDEDSIILGNTGSVQVVNGANEQEHFESYYSCSYGNKKLTLKPKNTIRSLVPETNSTKDIKIKIITEDLYDLDGNSVSGEVFSRMIKINHEMEKIPPVVSNFVLKKRKYDGITPTNNFSALSNKVFSAFGSDDFSLNHVSKNILFSSNVTDEGSGFKQLTVKETLIKTNQAVEVNIECDPTVYTQKSFSNVEYSLKSVDQGIAKLDFIFEDYAENKTTVTYYVVKDTTIDSSTVGSKTKPAWSGTKETSSDLYCIDETDTKTSFETLWDADGDGYITETIDLSKNTKDIYKNKYVYLKCKLEWGYDKDNLNEPVTDLIEESTNTYKFTITRDVNREAYLKIMVYDGVGNVAYIERTKPAAARIASFDPYQAEFSGKGTGNPYHHAELDATYSVEKNNAQSYGGFLIYAYQANPSATPKYYLFYDFGQNNFISGVNGCTCNFFLGKNWGGESVTDENHTPNGIYTFYLFPYYEYGERKYIGGCSKSFVFYHNYSTTDTAVTPVFPADFEIDIKDPVPSLGKREVSVSLPNSFTKTANCEYGFCYKKDGDTSFKYVYGIDGIYSYLESGYNYTIKLFARNNVENFVEGTVEKNINLTYDNIPPAVSYSYYNYLNYYKSNPQYIYLEKYGNTYDLRPSDSGGSGIYKNSDGKNELEYYFIRKTSRDFTANSINEEILSKYEKHVVTYDDEDKIIPLYVGDLEEDYYQLVLKLRDNKKDETGNHIPNEKYFSLVFSNRLEVEAAKFEVKNYGTNGNYTGYLACYKTISTFNSFAGNVRNLTENNEWEIKVENQNSVFSDTDDKSLRITTQVSNFNFMRGIVNNWNSSNQKSSLYGYFCPDYGLKLCKYNEYAASVAAGETPAEVVTKPVCNVKSMIPSSGNGYLVFYDAPCFIHTMAYPTDKLSVLEAKASEGNLDSTEKIWEAKGMEVGLKLISKTWEAGNYSYYVPLKDIPAGYSFVTITHFADGTSVMSDIKQK